MAGWGVPPALLLAAITLFAPVGAAFAEPLTTSLRPKLRSVSLPAPSSGVPVAEALPAAAAGGEASPIRPRARPTAALPASAALPVVTPAPVQVAAVTMLRPRPRPFAPVATPPPVAAAPVAEMAVLRPMPRPAGLAAPAPAPVVTAAAAPAPQTERRGGLFGGFFGGKPAKPRSTGPVAGSVCGDPAIRGEDIARITSKVRGCGIEEPVRVTMVDGIRLNSPATIDCPTARALRTWVDDGLRPAFRGKEIVELRIAASYICRSRNNVRGAKISEHGRGRAVDVAGVVFSDGSEITVSDDYGPALRRAHKAACGIFSTTLGPGSDGYHEDHLHFDTANNRGPYCR